MYERQIYRNLRKEKLQSKKNDYYAYNAQENKLPANLMKKIWQSSYNPQCNPIYNSSILKKYYDDVQQSVIDIRRRQRGQLVNCQNQRKVNLKHNPYIKAFNKMESIMKKNLLSSFFQFNQKKNVRMTQDQINLRKRMNKNNQKQ